MNTSRPKLPQHLGELPAYQQAMYLHHLDQLAHYNVTGPTARAHARMAATTATEEAKARVERAWPQVDRVESPIKKLRKKD